MHITLNPSCQAYVLDHGEHVTTMGFKRVHDTLVALVKRLKLDIVPSAAEIGTLPQLHQYHEALRQAERIKPKSTWFSPGTPVAVRKILEDYRHSGRRIRLFYGDPATGLDWVEENDIVGTIGRSTGTLKVPLLIAPGECSSPAILDTCIVRLIDADSGGELWRCRNYREPDFRIVNSGVAGRPWAVQVEGETRSQFPSYAKAAAWVAFMAGESVTDLAA